MLRVTVELIPDGQEDCRRTLGQLEIENIAGDSLVTGAYRIVMDEFDARGPGPRTTFRTIASLDNVERDLVRPMQLVGMALSVVAPVKRTMHRSEDVPQGTVLSRESI
ncbi:hypothetical protein QO239_16460 [Cupriavidus taiwanensis]|jgi:hypothetical protein|uniref:Uncharacterized protein n=5 Tax=Cupriavidus TaxID=106589 RepID=A0A0C4YN17_9BURK|nr:MULTISPECIES: hypothetical protein [Cupriavidus]AJG23459.1 hypothetical protein RR42_s1871 [Cupriavidus basilensis]AZG14467.1 hypothetical protein EHF44_14050 [Cupriavidus pauculus]KWW38096.1 hypothetical protein AU374_01877 [Cupriavidus metallidurans]MBY4732158.1 hypothetical protein [Cupriavidus pauculus]MBY4947864.1 hypothetical protein [Cupriavidus respiraculi]